MKKNASVFAAVMAITVLASLTVFTFAAVAPAAAPQTQALTDSVEDKIPVEPTSEPIPQNVSDRVIFANNSEIHAGEGSTIITDNTPSPTAPPTQKPAQPTAAPTAEPTQEPTQPTPTPEPTATPEPAQATITYEVLSWENTTKYDGSYSYENGTVVSTNTSSIISVFITLKNKVGATGTFNTGDFYLEAYDANGDKVTLLATQNLAYRATVDIAENQNYMSAGINIQVPENTVSYVLKYAGELPSGVAIVTS